jgi:hypothetical protein
MHSQQGNQVEPSHSDEHTPFAKPSTVSNCYLTTLLVGSLQRGNLRRIEDGDLLYTLRMAGIRSRKAVRHGGPFWSFSCSAAPFPSSQEPGFVVVQQDPASPVTDAARTSLVNVARLDDLGPFRRSSSIGEGF